MTDTTDDIAEEISFQSFDDDCKLLGNLLNDVLQREVGGTFMEKLERNRTLAQVLLRSHFYTRCSLRWLLRRFCLVAEKTEECMSLMFLVFQAKKQEKLY
jgi:hypothetical protein